MSVEPLVTVIMAAYNSAEYIKQAVRSVLKQTYQSWELIICDDASTDYTLDIISKLANQNCRLQVIANEINRKQAFSRNRCIECANGKYVAILDSDDEMAVDRLKKQVNFLENHPEKAFVGSSAYLFDQSGKWGNMQAKESIDIKDICFHRGIICASLMIRRKNLQEVDGYNISGYTVRGEDWDLINKIYYAGGKGANLLEPLYGYRVDQNAYNRRLYRYYIDDFVIRNHWFHKFRISPLAYGGVLKPLITGLIPKSLMMSLHHWQCKHRS